MSKLWNREKWNSENEDKTATKKKIVGELGRAVSRNWPEKSVLFFKKMKEVYGGGGGVLEVGRKDGAEEVRQSNKNFKSYVPYCYT